MQPIEKYFFGTVQVWQKEKNTYTRQDYPETLF